jgi:uncharacterized membrane protein
VRRRRRPPRDLRARRRGGPRRAGDRRVPPGGAQRRGLRGRHRRGRRPGADPRRGAEGGATYEFYDYARGTPIVVLAIAFAVVVGLVARLRGLAALVGLGFAFFMLLRFVLPGLLSHESPTLVSLVGSAAIMFVVLYLAHGFSARTTTALVGTLFGLALVAVLG